MRLVVLGFWHYFQVVFPAAALTGSHISLKRGEVRWRTGAPAHLFPSIFFQVCFMPKDLWSKWEQETSDIWSSLIFPWVLSVNVVKEWNWLLLRTAVLVLLGQEYFCWSCIIMDFGKSKMIYVEPCLSALDGEKSRKMYSKTTILLIVKLVIHLLWHLFIIVNVI